MVFRFRVVLDVLEDVFRDIELRSESTLEDFHNAIVQAFGFDGSEMASFYVSDEEWSQGEEVVLFDMSEGHESGRVMSETVLDTVFSETSTRMIYVYDFMDMWTFYVELADIVAPEPGMVYPHLMYSHGLMPETPPEKDFMGEEEDPFDEYNDPFDDFENLDDIDFDGQWN